MATKAIVTAIIQGDPLRVHFFVCGEAVADGRRTDSFDIPLVDLPPIENETQLKNAIKDAVLANMQNSEPSAGLTSANITFL